MKIAVPTYHDTIAPCFEVATSFAIATIEEDKIVSVKTATCEAGEGYRRVRLLQVHSVDVVICNGIKGFYCDMLSGMGMAVLKNINLPVTEALNQYASGRLTPEVEPPEEPSRAFEIPHGELLNWTAAFFRDSGYEVRSGPGQDAFLVDLVAQITCPVCRQTVRVAICCGAHTYRADLEVREFHHATVSNYDARVYVYPGNSKIAKCCQEYGIQFLDPEHAEQVSEDAVRGAIPLLTAAPPGHERAFETASDGRADEFRSDSEPV